jgi:hypothetical protein
VTKATVQHFLIDVTKIFVLYLSAPHRTTKLVLRVRVRLRLGGRVSKTAYFLSNHPRELCIVAFSNVLSDYISGDLRQWQNTNSKLPLESPDTVMYECVAIKNRLYDGIKK